MSTSTAAVKRYANALFLAAKDKGSVAKVEKELKLVADSLVATPALSSLLAHPGVDVTAKHKMIVEVFGKYVSELVLNMFNFCVTVADPISCLTCQQALHRLQVENSDKQKRLSLAQNL